MLISFGSLFYPTQAWQVEAMYRTLLDTRTPFIASKMSATFKPLSAELDEERARDDRELCAAEGDAGAPEHRVVLDARRGELDVGEHLRGRAERLLADHRGPGRSAAYISQVVRRVSHSLSQLSD